MRGGDLEREVGRGGRVCQDTDKTESFGRSVLQRLKKKDSFLLCGGKDGIRYAYQTLYGVKKNRMPSFIPSYIRKKNNKQGERKRGSECRKE